MNNKETYFDINRSAQRSDINLESPNSQGDLALEGFALQSLYDNFVFAEYIDLDNGFIKDEESGLLKTESFQNKTWRKAKVHAIGPNCINTSVGDIILFPNDKGLMTGETYILDKNSNVIKVKNGIFLDERRIFAKIIKR